MKCGRDKQRHTRRIRAKSRVALIAGGVRGIGRAIPLALAQRGWSVAACYRKSEPEAANPRITSCGAMGAQALIVRADVSDARNCGKSWFARSKKNTAASMLSSTVSAPIIAFT